MILHVSNDRPLPKVALEALIAQHGSLRILGAFLAAALTRAPTRAQTRRGRSADDLNDHLRRDIGLDAQDASPRYWDVRL